MCVLNGRFNHDNFTYVSHKGRSVVDYICVLHDQFNMYNNCNVKTITELIDQLNLSELVSVLSRPLDHSIISVRVNLSAADLLGKSLERKAKWPTTFPN